MTAVHLFLIWFTLSTAFQSASVTEQDSFGDVTLFLQHVAELATVNEEDANLSRQETASTGTASRRGATLGVEEAKRSKFLMLEDGEKVAVLIERGSRNGTWVPGQVTRKHEAGYYDVRVALGPKDRYTTQTFIGGSFIRRANKVAWGHEADFYAQNPLDAKEVVNEIEQDHERRYRLHLFATGMKPRQRQEWLAKREEAKRRRTEREMWEKGCPPGYKAHDGDARGADHFGRKMDNKQDTLDLCAEECSAKGACLSFEWSPQRKICNLNKVPLPEKTRFLDFIFCQRLPPAPPRIREEESKHAESGDSD